MKPSRVNIFNTPIDALSMAQTIEKAERAILEQRQIHHVAVNVSLVVWMQSDQQLRSSVIGADIINADGLPLVWTSRLLNQPLPERVAGIDLMENLVALAARKGYKIFLLGAKEEVVSKLAEFYAKKYSPKLIAGYRNGYFDETEEEAIADEINRSGANMLFVAITSPKKEIFLEKHKERLKDVNFIMGVGGSFDVIAGKVKRAPIWMQKSGLEWLFRVIQEPRRMWKRYLVTNSLFIFYLIRESFKPRSAYTHQVKEQ